MVGFGEFGLRSELYVPFRACVRNRMSGAASVSTVNTALNYGLESMCIRDLSSAPCFIYFFFCSHILA